MTENIIAASTIMAIAAVDWCGFMVLIISGCRIVRFAQPTRSQTLS
jgi:hypothetical protein